MIIFCAKENRNCEVFYCEVVCENKRNADKCPFRKTAQIQLDIQGNPIPTTPQILQKRRRIALKNPDKWRSD